MRPVPRLHDAVSAAGVLARTGVLRPVRPDRLVRMVGAYRHWGVSLASAFAISAARYANHVAVFDERGFLTYAELDARSDAIARGLGQMSVGPGDTVGVLCRNHRYFLEITAALAKVGADTLYLNTGFAPPQLADVMQRERATLVVHDDEFTQTVVEAGIDARLRAWPDDSGPDTLTLDALAARYADGPPVPKPVRESRTIILTSGTTGTPKGAAREQSTNAGPAIALLERIPYRAREVMVVAAPCFHSWGFTNALVGLLLGDTLVLARRFDPEATIAAIARHRAQVLAAVPVMLQRMLEVDAQVRTRFDTASLRLVPLSGSALPGNLGPEFMDAFGDVVFNLYGTTEVGYVTIASPVDLRAAPATAGRPPRGTDVRLLDDAGENVPVGATGRIFVRSEATFDGYTDGGTRTVVDGFMATGDTGHLDTDRRLFVDGREDEMIISGGENLFPGEVEDVLARHPGISEAAVVGVPDARFGQRLKAYVVRRDPTLDAQMVQTYVRDNLATFKVPRDVEFVDEIPRNATGKILRRDL